MQWTLLSRIEVICLSWISVTFPFGYIIKQFTFFFPLRPCSAALPVSPDVAPRIVMWLWIVPFSRKYSNVFPKLLKNMRDQDNLCDVFYNTSSVSSVWYLRIEGRHPWRRMLGRETILVPRTRRTSRPVSLLRTQIEREFVSGNITLVDLKHEDRYFLSRTLPGVRKVEKLLCMMSFSFAVGMSSGPTNFEITS